MKLKIEKFEEGYLLRWKQTTWGEMSGKPTTTKRKEVAKTGEDLIARVKKIYGIAKQSPGCLECKHLEHKAASYVCAPQGHLMNNPFYPSGCDSWEAK